MGVHIYSVIKPALCRRDTTALTIPSRVTQDILCVLLKHKRQCRRLAKELISCATILKRRRRNRTHSEDGRGEDSRILFFHWTWIPPICRGWLKGKACLEVSQLYDLRMREPWRCGCICVCPSLEREFGLPENDEKKSEKDEKLEKVVVQFQKRKWVKRLRETSRRWQEGAKMVRIKKRLDIHSLVQTRMVLSRMRGV